MVGSGRVEDDNYPFSRKSIKHKARQGTTVMASLGHTKTRLDVLEMKGRGGKLTSLVVQLYINYINRSDILQERRRNDDSDL